MDNRFVPGDWVVCLGFDQWFNDIITSSERKSWDYEAAKDWFYNEWPQGPMQITSVRVSEAYPKNEEVMLYFYESDMNGYSANCFRKLSNEEVYLVRLLLR